MTDSSDFVVRARRVVLPTGEEPCSIHVRAGRIAAVRGYDEIVPGSRVVDVADHEAVLPGVVDAHVHVNEPGRTEWEGFETATRAAAFGGITTVVDMPLNCQPVTTTVAAVRAKDAAMAGKLRVDVAFWGGVVPGDQRELEGMLDEGLPGFKCFLVHSGIDDFPNVVEADLARAMPILEKRNAVLLVHAEDPDPIAEAEAILRDADPRKYATFLASRPKLAEDLAITRMIRLCREYGTRTHVVHLSAASAVPMVEHARREGLKFSAETCPHYLTFASEEIADGSTPFKCCPPIRERDNRDALWAALRAGTISQVVSDHSPCTPALKDMERGDFMTAWGGIAGLQFGLSSTWTEASKRGFTLADLARWTSERTAALARLSGRKGAIVAGADADLVIFDPDATFVVSHIEHRHKVTPWAGRTLRGVVRRTILRGETIHEDGTAKGSPRGERLRVSS
ncbi:MAG: allantoinase AllB [Polyangiales bacterium]